MATLVNKDSNFLSHYNILDWTSGKTTQHHIMISIQQKVFLGLWFTFDSRSKYAGKTTKNSLFSSIHSQQLHVCSQSQWCVQGPAPEVNSWSVQRLEESFYSIKKNPSKVTSWIEELFPIFILHFRPHTFSANTHSNI